MSKRLDVERLSAAVLRFPVEQAARTRISPTDAIAGADTLTDSGEDCESSHFSLVSAPACARAEPGFPLLPDPLRDFEFLISWLGPGAACNRVIVFLRFGFRAFAFRSSNPFLVTNCSQNSTVTLGQ